MAGDSSATAVTLTVVSDDPAKVARATEAFIRMLTGLALDGIHAQVCAGPDEFDDDEYADTGADDEAGDCE